MIKLAPGDGDARGREQLLAGAETTGRVGELGGAGGPAGRPKVGGRTKAAVPSKGAYARPPPSLPAIRAG